VRSMDVRYITVATGAFLYAKLFQFLFNELLFHCIPGGLKQVREGKRG
jgi:hypothetical protein